ncbi:hypothetical protein QTP88_013822 [Uroleucon formosanum]
MKKKTEIRPKEKSVDTSAEENIDVNEIETVPTTPPISLRETARQFSNLGVLAVKDMTGVTVNSNARQINVSVGLQVNYVLLNVMIA